MASAPFPGGRVGDAPGAIGGPVGLGNGADAIENPGDESVALGGLRGRGRRGRARSGGTAAAVLGHGGVRGVGCGAFGLELGV